MKNAYSLESACAYLPTLSITTIATPVKTPARPTLVVSTASVASKETLPNASASLDSLAVEKMDVLTLTNV